MATVHLHRDDVPDTLALLGFLLGDQSTLPAGYDPDETGANVDWDLLVSGESWLSTTEKAVVRIAHGCAILERHGGGLPLELRWQVRATVTSTTE
jgi:hypothetical protein